MQSLNHIDRNNMNEQDQNRTEHEKDSNDPDHNASTKMQESEPV